ncbi:hypothetical protein M9458_056997 [Cirrhinus mrigala]|uniref:Integrase catalytic domain-containing protein n=1 Tax=Cirrhinus mrigala TaxID=683832 RepID=A0ABD0MF60_CIRMR
MQELKEQELAQKERKFKSAYENWKINVRDVRSKLKHECSESDLCDMMDGVEKQEFDLKELYDNMRLHAVPSQEIRRKTDACSAVTADLVKLMRVRLVEDGMEFDAEAERARLRMLLDCEYARSIYGSTVSRATVLSNHSKPSLDSASISAKRAETAALLAVKKAEVEMEADIDAQRQQLKKLENRRDIEVMEARLRVYTEEESRVKSQQCRSACSDVSNPSLLVSNTLRLNQQVTKGEASVVQVLQESMALSRLPVPEPFVFFGDPLKFIEWSTTFKALIERRCPNPADKLFYLQKYIDGEARSVLEGSFYRKDEQAYQQAWEKLNARYGHSFVVQRAFREKLNKWTKIGASEYVKLREFSDFLQSCSDAMPHIKGLQVLNDCEENQKILVKLPNWVTSSGLKVRGFSSDCSLCLPAIYTRDFIPFERTHIPTCETAKRMDCAVGLLIGYNFSRALAPRQVITGGDEEPYAIKTDLGTKDGTGLCHRISVRELPPVTPVAVIRALELDFVDTQLGEKSISQDDVQFLQMSNQMWEMCLSPQEPNKIRVVFDCSAKYEGIALNDHLLTGPDLTNGLTGVLCCFRKHPIAVMCDIEKMFHRFHVTREDRDYLRFLWWANGDLDTEPREYRMKVHLFGASSSPGCANYGLKCLASMNESEYPSAASFIRNNFYVDDGLISLETVEETVKLVKEAQAVCVKGKLHLHKFISNNREVLESINERDRAVEVKNVDFKHDHLPVQNVLGVRWDVESDAFTFNVVLNEKPATRRGILSVVASVYDPLGFLAPFIISGKKVLQEMMNHYLLNPKMFHPSKHRKVHCALVMGKARVAPTKVVTIPSSILKEELALKVDREYFWTDSQVVLGYISNEARRFHVFVANRVQRIRETTDPRQWYYINTGENPADYASRGLTIEELINSNWLTGPRFLWKKEIDAKRGILELSVGDPEVKAAVMQVDFQQQLSRRRASFTLVRLAQQDAFKEELHVLCQESGKLPCNHPLHLYPLNCGTRQSFQRIVSFTRLILVHHHQKIQHQGRGQTLNELRVNGFWIIGGSKVVAQYIRQCVPCRRARRPLEQQRMADLPRDRTDLSPPFTYCGMDCFGPFYAKQGRKEYKRYCLFTCLCSRAVHIEMLEDMTADAFINALCCFIAIWGAVRQIRSDQGTNFVGAKSELKNALKEMSKETVAAYLATQQCDFRLNAPSSSHAGGIWERQIRTVKSVMSSVLAQSAGRLNDASLHTFFYEAMSIVNNRPLTVDGLSDPIGLEPLTPNHLLTMKSSVPLPPPGTFVREDLYAKKRWRRVQYLCEQFWGRWRIEQRWHTPRRNVQVGDVVIVKEGEALRNEWRMARVLKVCKDDDGLVRKATIQMGDRGLSTTFSDPWLNDNIVTTQ